MATVPYSGTREVMPDTRVPDDYQHITATPDEFGGLIAKGRQELGAGMERAGQIGVQTGREIGQFGSDLTSVAGDFAEVAKFTGRINADDQTNSFVDNHNKIIYGDPNGPPVGVGPDGQPIPDRGYMGLEGRAAMDQKADVLKRLDDARQKGRENLSSPYEKLLYDEQTRRMYSVAEVAIDQHANTEWKKWAAGVNDTSAAQAMSGFVANVDNPEISKHHASDYIHAKVQAAQIKFGNDPAINSATEQQAKRDLFRSELEVTAVKQPGAALRKLEANRGLAGDLYVPLATQFRTRAQAEDGIAIGNMAIIKAGAEPPPILPVAGQVAPETVHGAIIGQESNGNPGVPTSVDSAVGIGQIKPATFAQYAKPGETIDNPVDNFNVSKRIVDDYYKKYNGDVNRVAVAYFSGPRNVAPPGSPTPWIRDAQDGNHTSTSAYVASIDSRLSGAAALKGTAYRTVMEQPDLSPEVRQHALTYINQRYTAAQVAADADTKALHLKNEEAKDGYVKELLGPALPPDIVQRITRDPNLTPETRYTLGQAALKKAGGDVKDEAASYGPGFWDAYKGVTAPVGDASRIADSNDILRRAAPGGDLTLGGAQKLIQVLKENQRNVNDQAVNTAKAGLMNYAKSKLSFESDTGPIKIRDPKGEALFNAQFIPKFMASFDEAQKAGKDPWQFLTQENVDKMISGMRSKADMASDRMRALGETPEDKPGAPLPPAPQGVKGDGWTVLMNKAPLTENGAPISHVAWANVLGMLARDPSQKNIEAFDRSQFGRAGFRGAEVLNQLGIRAPSTITHKETDAAGNTISVEGSRAVTP